MRFSIAGHLHQLYGKGSLALTDREVVLGLAGLISVGVVPLEPARELVTLSKAKQRAAKLRGKLRGSTGASGGGKPPPSG